MIRIKPILAAALLVTTVACSSSYYSVTDPGSGKIYYTKKIKENRDGSVQFEDASETTVTLQSSEIKKINKETYKANTPVE